jgi:hypothetical protein
VVFPWRRYALALADGDGRAAVRLIDVDMAAAVLWKATAETRRDDDVDVVYNFGGRSVSFPESEAESREPAMRAALADVRRRHPAELRLELEDVAAALFAERAAAMRTAWDRAVAAGEPPERALDAFLAHWSYFGYKAEGVEWGPSVGSRARAQSLKFIREEAARAPVGRAPAPGAREAAEQVWLDAQRTAGATQFLLSGEQVRRAARARGADAARGPIGSAAWSLVLSLAESARPNHEREQAQRWSALDPDAALALARFAQKWRPGLKPLPGPGPTAPPRAEFDNVTAASSVGSHRAGAVNQVSVGMAWLDDRKDGRPDLYVRSGPLGGRLYRNLGGLRFADVTAAAGLQDTGDRVVSADYDNDGHPDLFVLGDKGGINRLYHNEGDGTFRDVTRRAGLVQFPELAVAALWFDFDRDGFLDLLVIHSGRYRDGVTPSGPGFENGTPARLYRNNGDGTFTDVTARSGLADAGWGWGAVAFDYDDDGWPDVFICDTHGPSRLYRNQRDGTFRDVTAESGLVLPSPCGGASAADYDHSGHLSLFVSGASRPVPPAGVDGAPFDWNEFLGLDESTTTPRGDHLYRNLGGGKFRDVTAEVLPPGGGWDFNGFFFDYDRDGWQDLFVVGGFYPDDLFFHDDPKRLYRYDPARGRFQARPAGNGADFTGVSRGSTFVDANAHGCLDLAVTGFHGFQLLRGLCPDPGRHWLRLVLRGTKSNRDGIGARVTVRAGDLRQTFDYGSEGGGSVGSFSGGLYVGLGAHASADEISIRWPSGRVSTLSGVAADRAVTAEEPVR